MISANPNVFGGKTFGCCSSWTHCSLVGHCVRPGLIAQCEMARQIFAHPDGEQPELLQKWKDSAIEAHNRDYTSPYGVAFRKYIETGDGEIELPNGKKVVEESVKKEALEKTEQIRAYLQKIKNKPKASNVPPNLRYTLQDLAEVRSEKYMGTCMGLSIHSVEGEIQLRGSKVVAAGERFTLISWYFRDLVHYGICTSDKLSLVETFAPSKTLKGHELRKHVIEVYKKYEAEGIPDDMKHLVAVVAKVEEIQPGQIFVWWNPYAKDYSYGYITKESQYFWFCVKPDGTEGFFNKHSLQQKLDLKEIWVIERDSVPKEIAFPYKGLMLHGKA